MNCYDQRPIREIKDELGWKNGVTKEDLTSVCMILCDRVADLEAKIKKIIDPPKCQCNPLGGAMSIKSAIDITTKEIRTHETLTGDGPGDEYRRGFINGMYHLRNIFHAHDMADPVYEGKCQCDHAAVGYKQNHFGQMRCIGCGLYR